MYLVDNKSKKTFKINDVTFKDIGLSERKDLQEWIANNPDILGEELLIIQKEFDQFNNTKERFDLLAIDKNGNLVIIENKLDDSGVDVVWQAFKYAGYCASLSKDAIVDMFRKYLVKIKSDEDPVQVIKDFLDKGDIEEIQLNQDLSIRIILVAREFRKEVTNTALWASKYGIKIQCIKIIPYVVDNNLIVDIDQIIPVKDIQNILISYDEKSRSAMKDKEELAHCYVVRNKFWHKFLPKFNEKSKLFSGRNIDLDIYDHWYSTGSGLGGVVYSFSVTQEYAGVALDIGCSDKNVNKEIFEYFYKNKNVIEKEFGNSLNWERLSDRKASRISYRLENVNIFEEEDWNKIMDFLTENMIKFEFVLRKYINEYRKNK